MPKQNSGRKVWINGSGILEKIYKKYGISFETYQSGGSVATAAFEIARILKSKVVILVGQDLAYLGDNTHAGGIAERISDGDSLFVEDIYGGQIRTRNDWLRYLQWFEAAAKQLEGQIKIIDATEGGAKIQGTMIMRLQDAIAKYCRKAFCFEDILNEMEPTFSNARYCNIYKDILKIRDELETIKKNSKKGSEYSCIIMSCIKEKRITNKEYHEYINQLNMLKENVQKQNVYMLLDEYISEDVSERLSMLSVRYNDENEYFYESAKSNKILFQALEKSVRELSPLLNETLRNM